MNHSVVHEGNLTKTNDIKIVVKTVSLMYALSCPSSYSHKYKTVKIYKNKRQKPINDI